MSRMNKLNLREKIALFRRYFSGLEHVYGTYDPNSKRARVMKAPVTDQVIENHLRGRQPYGVFLLNQNRTRAIAVDFDQNNPEIVIEFVNRANHYRIPVYIERSKSKGFHGWAFFGNEGVLAGKARLVFQHVLQEIDQSDTEIFPKQDSLDTRVQFGNFINAPLFGRLVPKGRTAFVDPNNGLHVYPDQWQLLQDIQTVQETRLDEIIEINKLQKNPPNQSLNRNPHPNGNQAYGFPRCAQRILDEGVTQNQRVICFRLAVHLKRMGFPFDVAMVVLKVWALKNQPINGKRVISDHEIKAQAKAAYQKKYRSYGCEEAAIQSYCDPSCPIYKKYTKS